MRERRRLRDRLPPLHPGRFAGWLASGFVELAAPRRCGGCGVGAEQALCLRCRALLEPELLADLSIPHVDACVAAVAYGGPAADWLQRFKYPRPGLAALDPAPIGVMQLLAADAAGRAPGEAPALVVPVPLHPRRLGTRGFNPALLLAREVARATDAPCAPARLRRDRDTPSQTGLDRRGRKRNVAGAFSCRGRAPANVWLVDDVVTTGATLSECARVLRRAGARRIVAVCAARTPRERHLDTDPPGRADEHAGTKPDEARPMPRIKQSVTLLHRPNLDEEATPVHFAAGDALEILEEWESHYLCRRRDDPEGRLFNVRKELVDPS